MSGANRTKTRHPTPPRPQAIHPEQIKNDFVTAAGTGNGTATTISFRKSDRLLDRPPYKIYAMPGDPRNQNAHGVLDALVHQELVGKPQRHPLSPGGFLDEPLAGREYDATHSEADICLQKMLSWIETDGDEKDWRAHEAFYEIICHAIRRLNRIGLERPELLKRFASSVGVWPILYSDHKTFRQMNEKLLEEIEFAKSPPINYDKAAKTDFTDPMTEAATKLLNYLSKAQEFLSQDWSISKALGAVFDDTNVPKWYLETLDLKEFSKDTWPDWWTLGKQVFVQFYPHPERDARFEHVERGAKPGRRRSQIVWLIGDRMEKLARQKDSAKADVTKVGTSK